MATKENPRTRWLALATLFVALALTALPLPAILAPARPSWVALIVIYWSLFSTRYAAISMIFVAGLMLDVTFGTLLGQHAMALVVMAYLPLRFHLRMRVFSWLQLTAAVAGLLCVYHFVLFWINGIVGGTTHWIDYILPVLSGTLVWPVVMLLLDGLRMQEMAVNR